MKKKTTLFLTLLVALSAALPASAAQKVANAMKRAAKPATSASAINTPRNPNVSISNIGDTKETPIRMIEGDLQNASIAAESVKKGTEKTATSATHPNCVRQLVTEKFALCSEGTYMVSILNSNGSFKSSYLDFPGNTMLYGNLCYVGDESVNLYGSQSSSNTSSNTPYIEIGNFDPREPWYICLPYQNYSNNGRYYYSAGLQFQIVSESGTVLKTIGAIEMPAYTSSAMEVGQNAMTDCGSKARLRISAFAIIYE